MANEQNLKPFQPGQSGNPNGRPKKLPDLDALLAEVLNEEKGGIVAAQAILKVIMVKAIKGDLKAAELLLDRAYGKSKNLVDITSGGNAIPIFFQEIEVKMPADDDQTGRVE